MARTKGSTVLTDEERKAKISASNARFNKRYKENGQKKEWNDSKNKVWNDHRSKLALKFKERQTNDYAGSTEDVLTKSQRRTNVEHVIQSVKKVRDPVTATSSSSGSTAARPGFFCHVFNGSFT